MIRLRRMTLVVHRSAPCSVAKGMNRRAENGKLVVLFTCDFLFFKSETT